MHPLYNVWLETSGFRADVGQKCICIYHIGKIRLRHEKYFKADQQCAYRNQYLEILIQKSANVQLN